MLADDRSEVSLKRYAHATAAMDADETAAVAVKEMHLGMLASLIDLVDLKTGQAQRADGMSERCAH
jgi:hypothetical protein